LSGLPSRFPALEEAVQRDGKVRVIYKDWPIFGPPSERAASVALACAEQGFTQSSTVR
jgi:protein-disulfide isomerase